MSVRKSQGLRIPISSLSQPFTIDFNIDDDYAIFKALLPQGSTENDYEWIHTSCLRLIKHAAVQTTEVNEKYYSWLLKTEREAVALCEEVSNLLNTLLQDKNLSSKREQNSSSLDFALSKPTGDKKDGSVKTELDLPGFLRFNATSNLSFTSMLENIENKMQHVFKRATELRNSIHVVGIGNVEETSEKSVQIVMEKNGSELNCENWIGTKQYRTKTNAVSKEAAVKFKLQRSTTQISFVNSKTTTLLKKQTSSLNSNWKDGAFITSKISSNFATKNGLATANVATKKDLRATGATPKKTNDLHRSAFIPPRKRTDHQVTEISKTKKVTSQKPIWR